MLKREAKVSGVNNHQKDTVLRTVQLNYPSSILKLVLRPLTQHQNVTSIYQQIFQNVRSCKLIHNILTANIARFNWTKVPDKKVAVLEVCKM